MSSHNRVGNKWTVNEVLSLQREYELLGWDIDRIAKKHGRTSSAIMYKLDKEGFADYNELYSNHHTTQSSVSPTRNSVVLEPSLSDDEEYVDEEEPHDLLSDRVSQLESGVTKLESGMSEIKNMLKLLTAHHRTRETNRGIDF